MTEQLVECNLNMFSENTSNIKQELDADDYLNDKVDDPIEENRMSDVDNIKTELSPQTACYIIKDSLRAEAETGNPDIKIEFNNELLFCDHCLEHYQDYCSKCSMLVCILNKNGLTDIHNTSSEELPNDILEIRIHSGHVGVFALKCIPKGVRFGPFLGVSASECSWRLKSGKFILSEEKSTCLNWMQYINPAKSASEQNLLVFQTDERLYYRTIHKIYEGEELLVYFGNEYVDNLNENIEMVLIPHTESDTKDVYACTFCCLGFSSRVDLVKHKSTCLKETSREFSIKEIVQCSFCKIHLDAKEYMEYHMPYCSERYTRKHNPLAVDNQAVEFKRSKSRRLLQTYECKQCLYKTAYKADLKTHTNQHNEVKMYKCGICNRRFKKKDTVKAHVEKMHIGVEKGTLPDSSTNYCPIAQEKVSMFKCSKCKYQSTKKYYLKKHIKTKHLQEFDYKCTICGYKTNIEKYLNYHIKTKHLQKFDYKCDLCDYKTNYKSSLNRHVKTMCSTTEKLEANITWHSEEVLRYTQDDRKQFKCLECEFQTKYKQCMKRHIRTQHLKKFRYKCDSCEYMVDRKSVLEKHVKTVHLKVYNYNCEMCDWKSNERSHLKLHVQAKHFEVFKYKCESCAFKTNRMTRFKSHMKGNHLTEFKYTCSLCGYKTNNKKYLQSHMKTNHLEEFDYKCDIIANKMNQQTVLNKEDFSTNNQLKIQHRGQGSVRVYKCSKCGLWIKGKYHLRGHMKTKHLKKFDYKCNSCEYQTNYKYCFERHVNKTCSKTKNLDIAKHWKEVSPHTLNDSTQFKCLQCDFQTKYKLCMKSHVRRRHLKKIWYKCETCEYKADKKSHLEHHIKTKHLKDCSYKCELCKFESYYKSVLRMHVKAKHLKEFNHKCEFCKYKTNRKLDLEIHMKTKHLMIFDYQCDSCEYKTNYRCDFNKHMKSKHLKEFNYKCGQCEYKTNKKECLKNHTEMKHISFEKKELQNFFTSEYSTV